MNKTLDIWLTSPFSRNSWFRYESANVYLHKSHRLLKQGSEFCACIDIANIACERPHKGTFTRLVADIRARTHLPIFLENTHVEFATSLRRHGWIDLPWSSDEKLGIYCLYLPYAERD
jgi:hypothetical protein